MPPKAHAKAKTAPRRSTRDAAHAAAERLNTRFLNGDESPPDSDSGEGDAESGGGGRSADSGDERADRDEPVAAPRVRAKKAAPKSKEASKKASTKRRRPPRSPRLTWALSVVVAVQLVLCRRQALTLLRAVARAAAAQTTCSPMLSSLVSCSCSSRRRLRGVRPSVLRACRVQRAAARIARRLRRAWALIHLTPATVTMRTLTIGT